MKSKNFTVGDRIIICRDDHFIGLWTMSKEFRIKNSECRIISNPFEHQHKK